MDEILNVCKIWRLITLIAVIWPYVNDKTFNMKKEQNTKADS